MLEILIALMSQCNPEAAHQVTYSVEIHDAELESERWEFIGLVTSILSEERGWSRSGISFCPVDANPDVNIILALPDSVDELCDPIRTLGEVSCAINGNAVINHKRWTGATDAWEDLSDYRRYVINHEVGHVMGMIHRYNCTKSGMAPLMMQQSKRGLKCEPNSYPTSHEVKSLRRLRDKDE